MLYEMLTGQRLFKGETISDTLAAVLKEEPELERVPGRLRRLLRGCLEKDPKKRLQAICDWRLLIEEDGTELAPQAKALGTKFPWVVAAVSSVIALVVSFVHFRAVPPQRAVLRYTIAAPENTSSLHSFGVSPDGHAVVMAVLVKGKRQLWLRELDALQAQPIPGTDDATFPFWSPDSRYIGFFAEHKLKKVASGGPAQPICDVTNGAGGSWNRDNVIVFSPGPGAPIQRVSAEGGVPTEVTVRRVQTLFPVFLPDGHHFLYLLNRVSAEQNGIYISSLDGKENRRVLADESSVSFASGRLLFIRENTLMAQPFDAASGKTLGDAIPVAESVSFSIVGSHAPVTASEIGLLLYESGGVTGVHQMVWYDRGGKLLGTIGEPGDVYEPAISPDEKALVFRRASVSGHDLWLRDLTRGAEQRLTTDLSSKIAPVWSPNGDRIAFSSNRGGGIFNLYQRGAAVTGQDELLLATANTKVPSQWSRDGRFLIHRENDPKTKRDIWLLPMDNGAERKPIPLLRSQSNEFQGQVSPDGHWIAYTSDDSSQSEVYVRAFPAAERQWRISIAGGEQPRWSGYGKELFFISPEGKMMAVAVKAVLGASPSFEPSKPQPLFEAHPAQQPSLAMFAYDVMADGKRFLVVTNAGASGSAAMNVMVNWDAGLKK